MPEEYDSETERYLNDCASYQQTGKLETDDQAEDENQSQNLH